MKKPRRPRAEDALAASERDLRMLMDSIPAGVALMSATGEVEVVNEYLLAYLGWTLDQARHWGNRDVIHPDDLPRVMDAFNHSLATGEPYDVEQRQRRFDGTYRWFQCHGRSIRDADGRIVRWHILHIDIDDRKRAEAELQRSEAFLAEGQRLSSTGTFLWFPDNNEMTFSEELYRIHEMEPGVPMDSALHMSRTHPEDVPLVYATAARFQREGGEITYESRLKMPDGRIKHVRTFGRMIVDQDGRSGCLGVCQDFTAQKSAEDALNRARAELAHVSRAAALSALTASIAHEVNQPLAGIMTNASTCLRMLAAEPPNLDGARATAQRTLRDGNRASDVIQHLRAMFSRRLPMLEAVDLNDAAREVLALSAGELQSARVVLWTDLVSDLPTIGGDRVQLQQVILNLVLNAADAMRGVDDRPRNLRVATALNDTAQVVLTVRDAGVGLAPDSAGKLFDAFYTTKAEGMGIGLSISRSIIEGHEGRLWATANQDGPGATFAFSIPCEAEQTSGSAAVGAPLMASEVRKP